MTEFEMLFNEKLGLEYVSPMMRQHFFKVMRDYLAHGRTFEYVSNNLDKLLEFFECIGIGKVECVIILVNFPAILNIVDELYEKYLFLGIIENEDNSFRTHKFFSKTKDYRVGLTKMYTRYKMCKQFGYEHITWNTLVHSSDSEFFKIFIKGTYHKDYQRFETMQEAEEWYNSIDISDFDLDDYKSLPVNEELVEKYESKKRSR